MNGRGDEFLACSSLTMDQHGGVTWSDLRNLFEAALHDRAVSDDAIHGVAVGELIAQTFCLEMQFHAVQRAFHEGRYRLEIDRLG